MPRRGHLNEFDDEDADLLEEDEDEYGIGDDDAESEEPEDDEVDREALTFYGLEF